MTEKEQVKKIREKILIDYPFIAKVEITTFKDLEREFNYYIEETKRLIEKPLNLSDL